MKDKYLKAKCVNDKNYTSIKDQINANLLLYCINQNIPQSFEFQEKTIQRDWELNHKIIYWRVEHKSECDNA